MTQLTDVRNTTELKTGAQKYLRQIEIAAETALFVGAIGAINAAGKAVPASDTAGLIVLGRVEDVDTDNNVAEICSGVYLYENGEDAEALAITDLNKVVYVVDDQTVGKVGGSNKIVAGILRDVLTDGTVAVEIGNIAGDGVDGAPGADGEDGAPGADGSIPGGIYTADADDVTALSLTIDTGLDTVTSYAVQIRRAGVLIADDAVVSEAAGVLTVANGSSLTIAAGDKIHWLAAGTVAAE